MISGDSFCLEEIRKPLISVGVPVYNGGEYLEVVLRCLLEQTLHDIEIIISDNCSTDNTSQVIASFSQDSRIRYFTQSKPLKVLDHFRFVLEKARAPYFIFSAHDDLRSSNYLECLLEGMKSDNDAILAFSDVEVTHKFNTPGTMKKYNYDTSRQPNSFLRLMKQASMECFHFYGLWRTKSLYSIPFLYTSYWPDLPIMMAAAAKGKFLHVSGANFFYLEVLKTDNERVHYQEFAPMVRSLGSRQLHCVRTTFKCVSSVAGILSGSCAAWFVFVKFAIFFIIIYMPKSLKIKARAVYRLFYADV